jgi:hypothetical protein
VNQAFDRISFDLLGVMDDNAGLEYGVISVCVR